LTTKSIDSVDLFFFLDEECMLHDGCPFGLSVITRGYLLPQKYIIHSPAPYVNDATLIASCYQSALELAVAHKIRKLAFPCIGAGAKHFPLDAHAQVALQTVRRWLETDENRTKIDRIIFVFWRAEEHLYYCKWMPSVFPMASTLSYGEAAIEGPESLQFWAQNMVAMDRWIREESPEDHREWSDDSCDELQVDNHSDSEVSVEPPAKKTKNETVIHEEFKSQPADKMEESIAQDKPEEVIG